MTRLLIFPMNGNGLEALGCLGPEFELVGFIDDDRDKHGSQPCGRVYGREALTLFPAAQVLAVPGSASSFRERDAVISGLGIPPERWATVVHPRAVVSPLAVLGRNVLLMAQVVVTSNARIADHVCVLPNSVIHHDVIVEAYALIGSGVTIAGHSRIGSGAYIGSGSTVIDHVEVGARTLVGLGTNVIRSLPPGVKAVGNPARVIP